jgi:hypothetical protein
MRKKKSDLKRARSLEDCLSFATRVLGVARDVFLPSPPIQLCRRCSMKRNKQDHEWRATYFLLPQDPVLPALGDLLFPALFPPRFPLSPLLKRRPRILALSLEPLR